MNTSNRINFILYDIMFRNRNNNEYIDIQKVINDNSEFFKLNAEEYIIVDMIENDFDNYIIID